MALIQSFSLRTTRRARAHTCINVYAEYVSVVSSSSYKLAEAVCSLRHLAPGQVTVSGESGHFSRHTATFLFSVKATKCKKSQIGFHTGPGEGMGMHKVPGRKNDGRVGAVVSGSQLGNLHGRTATLPRLGVSPIEPVHPSVSALLILSGSML